MTSQPLIQPLTLPLYPDGAPGSSHWTEPEAEAVLPDGVRVVRNVSQPTLTAFLPEHPNGTAVIVCPGGAYHFLAVDHEGYLVTEWLNARGITAFMLKYRLIQTGDDFPECVWRHLDVENDMDVLMEPIWPLVTADVRQAVRMVRARADEWGIAPDRIGMVGFSAGASATVIAARQYDSTSRPDFAAPIYSAPPPPAPVPTDAPPLFILCADDDAMASDVSPRLYAEWKTAGRPVELHIYAKGGHGFGMFKHGLPSDGWIDRFGDWLKSLGVLA